MLHLARCQRTKWVATTCLQRASETLCALGSDLRVACSALMFSLENDYCSCKQTHAASTVAQIKSLVLFCLPCFFWGGAAGNFFCTRQVLFVTHKVVLCWLGSSNRKIKLLMGSLWFFCFFPPQIGILLHCNVLPSGEVSATGGDDIISDKHVFLVQVLNTSPHEV